jgi:hypothetical protein
MLQQDSLTASSTAQELLQRLIAEGLTPSGTDRSEDPAKYRKLLEVLFSACILNPIGKPVTPAVLEQAEYTLTILSRQTAARPELLTLLPPQGEPQIPLYKWILPRLIHAASHYYGVMGAEKLVGSLCAAAVQTVQVLSRDLPEQHKGYPGGHGRAVGAMRALSSWIQSKSGVNGSEM